MKKSRISLDAARIIALTAMIGFVDGRYKIDDSHTYRSNIALVRTSSQEISEVISRRKKSNSSNDRTAYRIEIRRGDTVQALLVDASTGHVLPS